MTFIFRTCALLMGVASGQVGAQELGRVISTQPVIQQVAVPRQVCSEQLVEVAAPKSGAGALLGAVAGGAIGNAVGQGSGNAAATVIGVLGGAVLGDRIEGSAAAQLQSVRSCQSQTSFENRTVGYSVVYEYAGRQYSTQMASDPGSSVPVQVSVAGAAGAAVGAAPAMPPIVQQNYALPQVVESRIIYQPYYARPRVLPPVQFHFGRIEGRGRHHHWR